MIIRLDFIKMVLLLSTLAGWAYGADSPRIPSSEENKTNASISSKQTLETFELKGDGSSTLETKFSESTDEGVSFGGGSFFQKGFQFGSSFGSEGNSLQEAFESDSVPLTTATLILPGDDPDPNQLRLLHEDMVVFSEILQEGLRPLLIRPDEMNTADSSGSFNGAGSLNHSTYIEGYGAVFLLYVDFPLIGRVKSDISPREDRKDLVWETAKERIWNSRPSRKPTEVRFDPQRIERLKGNLMEGIGHGSNIRGLSEKDWIVVAVQCRPPRPEIGFEYFYGKASAGVTTPGAATGRNNPSALILRVPKGVVNAFAEGRLTKEDYRKKVHVITY
ncbi:MAG: hypothetical protein GX455_01960 [Phycisphaerae bacterium]|nr:hypothetical protein [Phycisphaerae bacterium]